MRNNASLISAALLIFIIGLAFFGFHSLNNIILDDYHVLKNNPTITGLSWIPYHLSHFFNRSVFYISLCLNYHFSGLDPASYHHVNILLHICNALFVYTLCLLILRGSPGAGFRIAVAFCAGILFLIHPVQATTIHQISNRALILCAFFYLLACITFYFSLFSDDWRHRTTLYLLTMVFFLLSIASKSVGISFPVTAACMVSLCAKKGGRRIPLYIALVLVFSVFSCLLIHHSYIVQNTTLTVIPHVLTQTVVVGRYLALLIIPYTVLPEYVQQVESALSLRVAALILVHVSLLLTALVNFRRNKPLAFGLFWFYVTLAPSSALVPRDNPMLIYRLYLPCAGFFLVFSFLAVRGALKIKRDFLRRVTYVFLLMYLVLISAGGVYQNILVSDNYSMWQKIQKTFPDNHIPYFNLGSIHLRNGQIEKAIDHFKTSLMRKPDYAKAHYNLGTALYLKGSIHSALGHFKRSIDLNPERKKYYVGLGNALFLYEKYETALEWYEKYLRAYPYDHEVLNNISISLFTLKRYDEALGYLNRAVAAHPAEKSLFKRAQCLIHLRRYGDAEKDLNRLIQQNGQKIPYLFQKGIIAQSRGRYDEALSLYKIILGRDFEHVGALNNTAVIRYLKGDRTAAYSLWQRVLSIDPRNRTARLNLQVRDQQHN